MTAIAYAVAICALLILVVVSMQWCSLDSTFLEGCWQADPDFAKEAHIDDMVMMLDPSKGTGVLAVIMDDKTSSNCEFTVDTPRLSKVSKDLYSLKLSFSSDDDSFVWNDQTFDCILSVNRGSLEMHLDGVLMAKLIKNNNLTSVLV